MPKMLFVMAMLFFPTSGFDNTPGPPPMVNAFNFHFKPYSLVRMVCLLHLVKWLWVNLVERIRNLVSGASFFEPWRELHDRTEPIWYLTLPPISWSHRCSLSSTSTKSFTSLSEYIVFVLEKWNASNVVSYSDWVEETNIINSLYPITVVMSKDMQICQRATKIKYVKKKTRYWACFDGNIYTDCFSFVNIPYFI